jgi:hypothetical protein
MENNYTRDAQALWVRCPDCGRQIDVPATRVLAYLEYMLYPRRSRREGAAADPRHTPGPPSRPS